MFGGNVLQGTGEAMQSGIIAFTCKQEKFLWNGFIWQLTFSLEVLTVASKIPSIRVSEIFKDKHVYLHIL